MNTQDFINRNKRRLGLNLSIILMIGFFLAACQQETSPNESSFKITLSETQMQLTQGSTETLQLDVTLERSNMEAEVAFSVLGDVESATFEPEKTLENSSTLSFVMKSDLELGDYVVTVKAVAGDLEETADLKLSVQEASASQQTEESYAPGKTGEVKTVTINGETITFEEIDGLAIYQGDMILGPVSDLEALSQGEFSTLGVTCDGSDYIFFFSSCNRWEDGVVRFTLENDWGSDENNRIMRLRILSAISHWSEKTSLEFVESSSGDRLLFRNSSGCSSWVGRISSVTDDDQDVNVGMGCSTGNIIHEIGHAIGFFHEQSREDRDSFVRISSDNVESGKGHNFDRHVSDARDVGPYNFDSIMHYHCFAFTDTGEQTITPIDSSISCDDIGQRNGLSDGDVYAAYTLYPPSFSIEGIEAGASRTRTDRISLRVEFDGEDLDSDYVVWTSDRLPSFRRTGLSTSIFAADWPTGDHVVTASIIIGGVQLVGKTISFSLTNVDPMVEIIEPSSATGLSFCRDEAIRFRADSADVDSDDLPDSAYEWRVGSAAPFAIGASVTQSFSAGTYTVTVKVSDADGGSHEDSVSITVDPCTDTAPTVNITSPSEDSGPNDAEYAYDGFDDAKGLHYTDVSLVGMGLDTEDGTLSGASLVWTTNGTSVQPALLGTGSSLTARLYSNECFGFTHEITLTVTDSDGNTRTAIRRINIWTLC